MSLKDKAAIVAQAEKGRKKKYITNRFVIACSSLSTILKSKAAIPGALGNGARAQNKTMTAAAFPDVDKAVFALFCEQCVVKGLCPAKCFSTKHCTQFSCSGMVILEYELAD